MRIFMISNKTDAGKTDVNLLDVEVYLTLKTYVNWLNYYRLHTMHTIGTVKMAGTEVTKHFTVTYFLNLNLILMIVYASII